MHRTPESANSDTAHKCPIAGSKRNLFILATVCVWLAVPPAVLGADSKKQTQFSVEYRAPRAPGDPFSLRYQAPPGFKTAILMTNRSAQADPNNSKQTNDPQISLQTSVVLPLPADAGTGLTGVDGALPTTITQDQLESSLIDIRIVFYNDTTQECLVGSPIPLRGPDPPPPPDPSSGTTDPGTTNSLTTKNLANGGSGNTAASTNGGSQNEPSLSSKFAVGTNPLGTQFSTNTTVTAVADSGSAIITSIHDQPTPVQGSGH